MKTDSFFYIFDYSHMMHDAIDGGLVYECCDVTKDITTARGFKLKKGQHYEAVWFLFEKSLFQFIDWVPGDDGTYIPNPKTLIEIPQLELAPFLKW
jgi:hypothetical protein